MDEFKRAKIVSYYDQEIWHREEEPLKNQETQGRQTMQSKQLSLSHQDDCKTKMDIPHWELQSYNSTTTAFKRTAA